MVPYCQIWPIWLFIYPSVVKSLMCIGMNPNEFYYPKQQWYVAQCSGATSRPCSACGECQGSLSTTKGCCPSVAVCSCCSRCYVFRGFKERLVFCVLTRWRAARARARAPHQYQPVARLWHTVGLNGKNSRQKLDYKISWNWLMHATVWQILNEKWMQWPETKVMWICWKSLGNHMKWTHFWRILTFWNHCVARPCEGWRRWASEAAVQCYCSRSH